MMQRINSETLFTRRISNTNTGRVHITVYIDYRSKKYTIVEPHQESVFFDSTDVELANAKIKLLQEALRFIKKELNQKCKHGVVKKVTKKTAPFAKTNAYSYA